MRQLVMPRKADPLIGGQLARGKQGFGDPLGFAAIPPWALASWRLTFQVGLDLPGRARPQFGDGGQHLVDEPRILLDELSRPPPMAVLAHTPAHQRPILNRHQGRFVRPVFDE
ncbi:Uncharacterised protein [Mycobacteroides abscessus subsp. abscessus]|nr:Uncharacterised protein [Mycobacteroides abscessus subsp. abscessus]